MPATRKKDFMVTYIYLLVQDIVIRCVGGVNCTSVSTEHFSFLLAQAGFLELIFELPLVVRIFKSKKETESKKD